MGYNFTVCVHLLDSNLLLSADFHQIYVGHFDSRLESVLSARHFSLGGIQGCTNGFCGTSRDRGARAISAQSEV